MSRPESHLKLMQIVEHQKLSSGILCSPYFATLQNSEMSRSTIESTQRFFFAVRFFSRAMAALAARNTESATHLPLIHNLAEEHGLAWWIDTSEI